MLGNRLEVLLRHAARPNIAARGRLRHASAPVLLVACFTAVGVAPASAAALRVSPAGSDSAACTPTAPCRSLARAYQAAQPGDIVQIAGGSYGSQTIPAGAKPGSAIRFQAENGAVPLFDELTVRASNVVVSGPARVTGLSTANPSGARVQNTTVEGIEVDGGGGSETPGYIAWVDGVTWRNVDIHNVRNANALLMVDGGYPQDGGNRNVVIENSRFHDSLLDAGNSVHTQCVYLNGGTGVTFRSNHFYNCALFDIFQSGDTSPTDGVTLENNVFEAGTLGGGGCCFAYTVRFAWGVPNNVLVRNNTSEQAIQFRLGATNSRVVGNVIRNGIDCASGVSFSHNVISGKNTCGISDKRVSSLGFANPDAHDFHLVPASPAIDAGDPLSFPATDRDGTPRPQGAAPDAGAYEHRSGSTLPPGGGPGAKTPDGAPRKGLVGAWGFNESSGRVVLDNSVGRNHGVLRGGTRVAGRFGRAIRFDGRNDLVTVPHATSLNMRRALTISAWVRPSSRARRWRAVVVKEHRKGLAYGLYSNNPRRVPSGHVRTRRDFGASGRAPLSRGAWSHLALTWNGRTQRLYLNGKLIKRARLEGSAARSKRPLRFGGNTVWGEHFKGVLDEIRIYRRAIGPGGIRAAARTPIGRAKRPAPVPRRVKRLGRHGTARVDRAVKRRHRARLR
jgi:hypothetical protein